MGVTADQLIGNPRGYSFQVEVVSLGKGRVDLMLG
jgi:hypothetical protein